MVSNLLAMVSNLSPSAPAFLNRFVSFPRPKLDHQRLHALHGGAKTAQPAQEELHSALHLLKKKERGNQRNAGFWH